MWKRVGKKKFVCIRNTERLFKKQSKLFRTLLLQDIPGGSDLCSWMGSILIQIKIKYYYIEIY